VRQECTVRRRSAEQHAPGESRFCMGGRAQEIALDGEIVAPDDRGAHIDEDVIAGNRPARARIATRLAGPTLAPSGGPATRCGYHCRSQPGSAHGKPADIGRQNHGCGSRAGVRLQAPGGIENAPPKSGTKSSNPASSSGQSASRTDSAILGREARVSRGYAPLGWRRGRQRRAGARRDRLNRR
jgi:hypothetical protein